MPRLKAMAVVAAVVVLVSVLVVGAGPHKTEDVDGKAWSATGLLRCAGDGRAAGAGMAGMAVAAAVVVVVVALAAGAGMAAVVSGARTREDWVKLAGEEKVMLEEGGL